MVRFYGWSDAELRDMSPARFLAYQNMMPRLRAEEGLFTLALLYPGDRPQDLANRLSAKMQGLTVEEFEAARMRAEEAAYEMQRAMAVLEERRLRKKKGG